MVKLTLSEIQSLAASPDYGGRGFLYPASAVLGLSWALYLSNLSNWQGAGYKLTDGEIDDIQAMVAQLEEDLMVTGDMYPQYKVKVSSTVDQIIPDSTWTPLLFDSEVYDPQDMHSIVSNPRRINILSSGLYVFSAIINWGGIPTGKRVAAIIKYDAGLASESYVMFFYASGAPGTTEITIVVNYQDDAEQDDYYYLRVFQTSGAPMTVIGGEDKINFAMVKV